MNSEGSTKFSSLFSSRETLCQVEASTPEEVIKDLLTRLALERGIGNVDEAFDAVMEREALQSTVLAPGLAIPHARLESVDELRVGVANSREGIAFGDETVHLVVLILAPKQSPASYLQAVSSLAQMCSDEEFVPTVADMEKAEDVWRFFDRGGVVLPAFVCAGDIMNTNVETLGETDTLQTAIDKLVTSNELDMPVVDSEGELVGVVTLIELMKVCLPDYILWMEDLSPIINFEPFAEIIRNEANTWLNEIMSVDYAAVSEEVPAIQVAKEIMRRGTRVSYVVRGRKLVGRIRIQDFVNKVLRE